METKQLPFDGDTTPEPPSTPAVGHWVTVKDDDNVGDDAGVIMGSVNNLGAVFYFVGFKDIDGILYHVGKYLQEEMTFVGYDDPN